MKQIIDDPSEAFEHLQTCDGYGATGKKCSICAIKLMSAEIMFGQNRVEIFTLITKDIAALPTIHSYTSVPT